MNPTFLTWADCVVMVIILLLSLEQTRLHEFYSEPLRTLSFVLLAVGSFGRITYLLFDNHEPHWWGMCMDSGFMLYGIRMWHQKFTDKQAPDYEKLAVPHPRHPV